MARLGQTQGNGPLRWKTGKEEHTMAEIQIAVVNASTVLDDATLQPMVDAVQQQIHGDFAPAWGVDADLIYVPQGQQ